MLRVPVRVCEELHLSCWLYVVIKPLWYARPAVPRIASLLELWAVGNKRSILYDGGSVVLQLCICKQLNISW